MEYEEQESKAAEPQGPMVVIAAAPKTATVKRRNVGREYLELLAETAVFVFFIMTFVAQASMVPTPSMENTILVGDFLLVNKMAYAQKTLPLDKIILPSKRIEKNDLVTFKFMQEGGRDLVKRVVATAGDTIEIKDKQVYLNGKSVYEPFKLHRDGRVIARGDAAFGDFGRRDNFGPVTVPSGNLFVMGDNRDDSYDSRFWGFLPVDTVRGRPWVIWFSYRAEENSHLKSSIKDRLRRWTQYFPRARWRRLLHIIS